MRSDWTDTVNVVPGLVRKCGSLIRKVSDSVVCLVMSFLLTSFRALSVVRLEGNLIANPLIVQSCQPRTLCEVYQKLSYVSAVQVI